MPNLEEALPHLIGAECWAIVAGAGNGSRMTLHIGRRVPRTTPISSAQEPIRSVQGELCLFVEGCSWRLQSVEQFVCAWNQDEQVIGRAMQAIAGSKITSVKQLTSAHDLQVEFDGGYTLTMFCDQMAGADAMDNYSIRIPGRWYTVKAGGDVSVSESKVG